MAVTGVGLVTPVGLRPDEAWGRSVRRESGIAPTRRLVRGGGRCVAAAEVPAFELGSTLRLPKNEKFMGPSVRFLVRAALDALAFGHLDLASFDPYRVALYSASGQTGLEGSELFAALELAWTGDEERDFANLGGRPSRLIDRYFSLRTLSNAGLGLLSAEIGAKGPSDNFVQGDVAPVQALGAARHDLLEDRADVAIVGACDSLLDVSPFLAYDRVGLLSSSDPGRAHRPFDRDRDGVVLGEGAAVLVLERGDDARRRGAPIAGEIVGTATATEADDLPEGRRAEEAVRLVIAQATGGAEVDLVVAHGIGTVEGDRREAEVLAFLVGTDVPVAAFKGLTGYLGAAATLVECALALESLRRRCVPPIARHEARDAECRLDLVTDRPRPLAGDGPTSLCLSRSWLGQCGAVALRGTGAA